MSACVSVRLCVCPSVCVFTFEVPFKCLPLPEVGCPIFLEIRNPWGKVMERSGLTFEHSCLKIVSNRRAKKSFFCWFCLTKHGGNHASRWIRDLWSKGVLLIFASSCVLDDFFRFSKKSGFWVFLVHPETTLPDGLKTSGRRAYRYFWHISRHFWVFGFWMSYSVFQKNCVLGYSWSTLLWHLCYYPHWSRDALSPVCEIFKASALWADAFYKSKCPSVCLSAGPPPPLFWELWSPLGFFLRRFSINLVIYVCLEIHFGYNWNKLWLGKPF